MHEKVHRVVGTLILVIIIASTPTAQGGDLIDYLPEVLQARSISSHAQFSLSRSQGSILTDCPQVQDLTQFPDHFLIDQNGQFRDEVEMAQLSLESSCLFFQLFLFGVDLIQLLHGEIVEIGEHRLIGTDIIRLQPGDLIDGSKQAIRFLASQNAPIDWFLELRDADFRAIFPVIPEFEDFCQTLREWSRNGNTLELRYTAFGCVAKSWTSQ